MGAEKTVGWDEDGNVMMVKDRGQAVSKLELRVGQGTYTVSSHFVTADESISSFGGSGGGGCGVWKSGYADAVVARAKVGRIGGLGWIGIMRLDCW